MHLNSFILIFLLSIDDILLALNVFTNRKIFWLGFGGMDSGVGNLGEVKETGIHRKVKLPQAMLESSHYADNTTPNIVSTLSRR